MYTKKYKLMVTDVDPYFDLKMSALLQILQDVATEHAELLNIGKANTIDKNMYWVITRYSLTIHQMPKYLQDIVVETYPGDDMKFIFPRYFNIKDEEENLLITISSSWCVLSKDTHRVSLNPFDGRVMEGEHTPNEEPLPTKISVPENLEKVDSRKVRYNDIDLNSHLNNTRYAEFLIDLHDMDFYKDHQISHMEVNFNKEAMLNDRINFYSNNGNPEYLSGRVNDVEIFNAVIKYKQR